MSVGESSFSVTEKNAKGNLCTIRGNSFSEFRQNLADALGEVNALAYLNSFIGAFTGVQSTAQAVANAAPITTPTQQTPSAPAQAVSEQPPGDAPQCKHGQRVFVDKPARGKPWRRWECANPWKPGQENADYNAARCKPVNA